MGRGGVVGVARVSIRSYFSSRLLWMAMHQAARAGAIERAYAGGDPRFDMHLPERQSGKLEGLRAGARRVDERPVQRISGSDAGAAAALIDLYLQHCRLHASSACLY